MRLRRVQSAAVLAALALCGYGALSLHARPAGGAYNQDGIEYRTSGPVSPPAAERLHQVLLAESADLAARLETPTMAPLRVYIAHDAAAFARATGRNWFVAALYAPEEDRLYFQNPAGLHARGLLVASARHELCHRAAADLRERQGGARRPGAWLWLEEGLCETIGQTPANASASFQSRETCTREAAAVHALVRGATELEDFGRIIERNLIAPGFAARRSALCAAGRFGAASLARRPAAGTLRGVVALQTASAMAARERDFFAQIYADFRARFVGIERTMQRDAFSL